jgi:hypothetical protein
MGHIIGKVRVYLINKRDSIVLVNDIGPNLIGSYLAERILYHRAEFGI